MGVRSGEYVTRFEGWFDRSGEFRSIGELERFTSSPSEVFPPSCSGSSLGPAPDILTWNWRSRTSPAISRVGWASSECYLREAKHLSNLGR